MNVPHPQTSYSTRALATQLLVEILTEGHSLSQALPPFKTKCLNTQDAAFLQALVYGVLRFYPRLSFVCDQLLQKPIKPKDVNLYYLCLIGLYQLMFMRVAPHAIISETVEAARILKKPWATGLVNAILREYQRQASSLESSIASNLIATYAHPKWLLTMIQTAWPTHWKSILNANNEAPILSLRVNTQKTNRDNYLAELEKQGFEAISIIETTAGIILKTPVDVVQLPGFHEGLFSVQDGAAQLAAELLELKPGLRVLDACAAPGGKTTHLFEIEPDLQDLWAIDVSPERTKLIEQNILRLHGSTKTPSQLKILTANANNPNSWWDGKLFDRILLDAPCSATGVIRRHPDIKYLRKSKDIPKLALQQKELLKNLWPLLSPGGLLLYATCSILPQENREVIQAFLEEEPTAKIIPISIPGSIRETVGQQILPGQNNMDGFYYALLAKN